MKHTYKSKTFNVETAHTGKYHAYGDSFTVLNIITDATKEETIEFAQNVLGYKDIPPREKWDTSNPASYFAGYYTISPTQDGWLYTKCSPYTD